MILYIKAFHVIAIICWMAGLLYLPRLYVYHAEAASEGKNTDILKVMQQKLLRIIMNPAMIVAWLTGLFMIHLNYANYLSEKWFWAKVICVIAMTAFHMVCAKWRKQLLQDELKYSGSFFRKMNEVPTILMIIIVIMAIAEPF